jgi:hypothetical protein
MRKYALSAVLAVLLLSGGATAAAAADTDGYGPDTPPAPTLVGTMVAPSCESDVPWINYSIVMNDPGGLVTSHTALIVLSDGNQSTTIPLGELVNGRLSGRVLARRVRRRERRRQRMARMGVRERPVGRSSGQLRLDSR